MSHRAPTDTVFAFSAHPDPAVAVGEVLGAVHDSQVMATTVLGLFAGSWPGGSRRLAWRTVCRVLQPEVAVAGALPEILYPRADIAALSDRRQHQSLALVVTDLGPAEIVTRGTPNESDPGCGPMVVFTGRDVLLTSNPIRPRTPHGAGVDRSSSRQRSFHRFLTVDADRDDPLEAAVRFDPTNVSLLEFQGARTLQTGLPATIHGREVTAIDGRPGLEVIEELTAEIDRSDLVPEALLIGIEDHWHGIIAVDRATASLILSTGPDITDGRGAGPSTTIPSTVTVAVPDLLDAVIAVEHEVDGGQRPLLAVSSRYVQRPNEIGVDHDVDDVAAGLSPLIVPSVDLRPGAVRALVFGDPAVR